MNNVFILYKIELLLLKYEEVSYTKAYKVFGPTFLKGCIMGNRNSYTKLSSDEGKVCIIFPCYMAIHKTTYNGGCVCHSGKTTDNPDEMVVLTNRFYFPDKKIGFYFFKPNNVYEGEPFELEESLLMMHPAPLSSPNETDNEHIMSKNLYDAFVARYDWLFDADGNQKIPEDPTWPFVWSLKQKKELNRLNRKGVKPPSTPACANA
jgi:hypothetical protein